MLELTDALECVFINSVSLPRCFAVPPCPGVTLSLYQVPPSGKGSLYIRPLLIGSGPVLGLAAAPEYSFVVYVSPVGNYFTGSIDLKVEEHYHRAAPGGTGAAKAIGNYSPVSPYSVYVRFGTLV